MECLAERSTSFAVDPGPERNEWRNPVFLDGIKVRDRSVLFVSRQFSNREVLGRLFE